ncbi:hypothetical protein Tco_1212806 [Tanacetum coccineum]
MGGGCVFFGGVGERVGGGRSLKGEGLIGVGFDVDGDWMACVLGLLGFCDWCGVDSVWDLIGVRAGQTLKDQDAQGIRTDNRVLEGWEDGVTQGDVELGESKVAHIEAGSVEFGGLEVWGSGVCVKFDGGGLGNVVGVVLMGGGVLDLVRGLYCRECALTRKTLEEVFQNLQDTFGSSDDNTNVVNAPREPIVVKQDPDKNSSPSLPQIDHCCHNVRVDSLDRNLLSNDVLCKSCGKNLRTVLNQDFNFPQTYQFQQQRLGCEKKCWGPHETFVNVQPMKLKTNRHEQNSCYNSNSFGFDQDQPPQFTVNHPIFNSQNELLNSQNEFLNSQNELLNSSNKLMEQMTTLCDLVGQAIQKKEEEKRIAEEQAAKDRYWKIPICYDDDEDDTIIITPVLPIEEPVNSLSMGDKHLDTIPETNRRHIISLSANHEEFADELTHIMPLPELEYFKFKIEPDPEI